GLFAPRSFVDRHQTHAMLAGTIVSGLASKRCRAGSLSPAAFPNRVSVLPIRFQRFAMRMYDRCLRFLAGFAVGVGFAAAAQAQNFTWRFEQIYSNLDGNIQFVVVYDQSGNANNQDQLSGTQFQSVHNSKEHAHDPGYLAIYTFPNNLPSSQTAGRRFLI